VVLEESAEGLPLRLEEEGLTDLSSVYEGDAFVISMVLPLLLLRSSDENGAE
jgi:hypothetical protein